MANQSIDLTNLQYTNHINHQSISQEMLFNHQLCHITNRVQAILQLQIKDKVQALEVHHSVLLIIQVMLVQAQSIKLSAARALVTVLHSQ